MVGGCLDLPHIPLLRPVRCGVPGSNRRQLSAELVSSAGVAFLWHFGSSPWHSRGMTTGLGHDQLIAAAPLARR